MNDIKDTIKLTLYNWVLYDSGGDYDKFVRDFLWRNLRFIIWDQVIDGCFELITLNFENETN